MVARPLPDGAIAKAAAAGGTGYWLTNSAGAVYTFGNAANYGSMAGKHLGSPVVGIVSARTGRATGWSPRTGVCSRLAPLSSTTPCPVGTSIPIPLSGWQRARVRSGWRAPRDPLGPPARKARPVRLARPALPGPAGAVRGQQGLGQQVQRGLQAQRGQRVHRGQQAQPVLSGPRV